MTTIYKVFDGAWFNAKYAIENDWKDKHVVLLFPEQVYPHTEEQQLSFPLLDMLKANMEYKEEDYVRGLGTLKLNSTKEYIEKYTEEFYLVDLYYRRTLEAYHELITKENPIEQTLSSAKRGV